MKLSVGTSVELLDQNLKDEKERRYNYNGTSNLPFDDSCIFIGLESFKLMGYTYIVINILGNIRNHDLKLQQIAGDTVKLIKVNDLVYKYVSDDFPSRTFGFWLDKNAWIFIPAYGEITITNISCVDATTEVDFGLMFARPDPLVSEGSRSVAPDYSHGWILNEEGQIVNIEINSEVFTFPFKSLNYWFEEEGRWNSEILALEIANRFTDLALISLSCQGAIFHNLSTTETYRIKVYATNMVAMDNGNFDSCFTKTDNGANFCLLPRVEDTISCDSAEDSVRLRLIKSDYGSTALFIEVNGVFKRFTDNPNTDGSEGFGTSEQAYITALASFINENYSDIYAECLESETDYYTYILNISNLRTDISQRIRLGPKLPINISLATSSDNPEDTGNQSFILADNGWYEVCLSPGSCYPTSYNIIPLGVEILSGTSTVIKYSINDQTPIIQRVTSAYGTHSKYMVMEQYSFEYNGVNIFEMSGNNTVSYFRAYQFNSIYGANVLNSPNMLEFNEAMTFKFLLCTEEELGDSLDLVNDLFGRELEIHSCAARSWPGL